MTDVKVLRTAMAVVGAILMVMMNFFDSPYRKNPLICGTFASLIWSVPQDIATSGTVRCPRIGSVGNCSSSAVKK